ncbi:hypothetical protein NK6_9228 [Bradyrhizobium diazoefficiens]|uniref:Uncharacterized protein n=1 Tax=Bradyrhizobium diazoefficiens TaxID=1355477 RepID=A0A0E4G125_9BRAD|nr:hypothetical protein NK6_9228 [Bradyrhizobium diazoefficiens]
MLSQDRLCQGEPCKSHAGKLCRTLADLGRPYLNPRRRRPPLWLWRKVRSDDGSKVAAGPSTCGD